MTAFKRGPHGRLVFAKCVLPSVNKVYYYYYYYFNEITGIAIIASYCNDCEQSEYWPRASDKTRY